MGKATQDLVKEHNIILHALIIMDKIITKNMDDNIKIQYLNDILNFFKVFADKCHHGKEEKYLFVELVNKGISKENGPVGVMLIDHAQGREYISAMSNALTNSNFEEFRTAAYNYIDLLRLHIKKENEHLFIMADHVLDEKAQDELFEQFEDYEKNVMGEEIHEKLHALIKDLARKFDDHDREDDSDESCKC